MKEKIKYIMESEGLSTTRMAEALEIQPSAISHLVSGRNKPGYDLIQRILRRFPRVNPDWLLLDSQEPYRGAEGAVNGFYGASTTLFDGGEVVKNSNERDLSTTTNSSTAHLQERAARHTKSPVRVVLLHDDGSCESYSVD